VLNDVRSHCFQTVVPGDQVILTAEFTLKLPLLILVQLSLFQQLLHLLIEVLVGELQLRDAVLVVERNCGPILNGLRKLYMLT